MASVPCAQHDPRHLGIATEVEIPIGGPTDDEQSTPGLTLCHDGMFVTVQRGKNSNSIRRGVSVYGFE